MGKWSQSIKLFSTSRQVKKCKHRGRYVAQKRDQNLFNLVSEWPQMGMIKGNVDIYDREQAPKRSYFLLLCRIIIYDILRPIVFDIQSLNSTTEVKTSGWLLFKHSPSWLKIPDNFQLPAESKHINGAPVSCCNWKQINDYFFKIMYIFRARI